MQYGVTKQLMAWTAILMLFVQPLCLRAGDCGCCSTAEKNEQQQSCCSTQNTTASCCSKSASGNCCNAVLPQPCSKRIDANSCDCGDRCDCTVETPGQPAPAVPLHPSQRDHNPSAWILLADQILVADCPVNSQGCGIVTAFLPVISAQEYCALLSRFTC